MVRLRQECRPDRLKTLLAGELTRRDEAALDAHLATCAGCRAALEQLAAARAWWAELPRLDDGDDPAQGGGDVRENLAFLEPSDDPGALGRLGQYEVEGVLGRGGMGIVLRAFDPALHRAVAIKVIAPELATSAAARRRFALEARAAAAVSHDHVVAIHAVAESRGGLPYFVMPYIPGQSLHEKLEAHGPLSVGEILRIGIQVASGLAAAHAQGLVHRDVKPANILLENGVERVKITDFGLARVVDDASGHHSGFIAGTPQYMSPEQANGERVDPRSDLFSLGSVLYAMAAGHSPFRAATNTAVLRRVCDDQPRSLREINAEVPGWLAAIIGKLHAKDPAGRFDSAAEVAELLGRCLAYHEHPDGSNPPFPSIDDRRRSGRLAAWSLAAALGAGLVLVAATGTSGVGSALALLATVLRIKTPAGTLVIEVDDPAISVKVDGESLVVRGAGPQEIRLSIGDHRVSATKDGAPLRDELVTITRDERRTLVIRHESNPEGAVAKSAPETPGSMIAVPENYRPGPQRSGGQVVNLVKAGPVIPGAGPADLLRPVPLSDRAPAPLWPGVAITYMAYSPDAKLLALACNGGSPQEAFNVGGVPPTSNRTNREIILLDLPAYHVRATLRGHSARVMQFVISPDGTKVAAATGHWGFSARSGEVWLWDLTKPDAPGRAIVTGIPMVFSVAFSPDGKTLAYGGWDHLVSLYDLPSGAVRAVCRGHEEKVRSVAFSPDGTMLASGGADKQVRLWNAESAEPIGAPLSRVRTEISTVAFSPDGKVVAAQSIHVSDTAKDLDEFPQITVWDVATRRERARLSGHPNGVMHLAFAPDGKTMATAGGTNNASGEVILWDAATWTRRTTMSVFPTAVECVAYSPDSTTLMAATTHKGNRSEVRVWDLRAKPAGASRDERTEEAGTYHLRAESGSSRVWSVGFSPEGDTLAFGSGNWNSHGSLWLWELGTGSVRTARRERVGVRAVAYAPHGGLVALGTFDGTVVVCDSHGNEARTLDSRGFTLNALAFSPDGATLAAAAQDRSVIVWAIETGQVQRRYHWKDDEVWSLAFRPDGKAVALGFKSGAVAVANVADTAEPTRFAGHEQGVSAVVYTPDGARLITASWDHSVRIWDPATHATAATLKWREQSVSAIAVSHDGRWLAAAEGGPKPVPDGAAIVLWDLAAREVHQTLLGHTRPIWSLAFSPDGRTLASGGEDGAVKLWNVSEPRSSP